MFLFSLAIHLSIAKMVGSRSVTYIIIEPDLKKMNILAKIILYNLKKDRTGWIDEFRQRKMELVESFYLTVTDKDKVGKQSRNSLIKSTFLPVARKCCGRTGTVRPTIHTQKYTRYISIVCLQKKELFFYFTGFTNSRIWQFYRYLLYESRSAGFTKFSKRFEQDGAEGVDLSYLEIRTNGLGNWHVEYRANGRSSL